VWKRDKSRPVGAANEGKNSGRRFWGLFTNSLDKSKKGIVIVKIKKEGKQTNSKTSLGESKRTEGVLF